MRWWGYDEPMWFCGSWEFGIFDDGWVLSHRSVIKLKGGWPTYITFHKGRMMPYWMQSVFFHCPPLQRLLYLVRCPGGSGWAWRCVRGGNCGCSNERLYRR
jgi:hypothetical protein